MMARPTKLTKELADKIIVQIRRGLPIARAAARCSVPKSTLHDWFERASEGKRPYSEQMLRIDAERAEWEALMIGRALDAVEKSPRNILAVLRLLPATSADNLYSDRPHMGEQIDKRVSEHTTRGLNMILDGAKKALNFSDYKKLLDQVVKDYEGEAAYNEREKLLDERDELARKLRQAEYELQAARAGNGRSH